MSNQAFGGPGDSFGAIYDIRERESTTILTWLGGKSPPLAMSHNNNHQHGDGPMTEKGREAVNESGLCMIKEK
jgi:hypothetical protein